MADEFDDDDELGDIEEGGSGGGLKKILIIVGWVVLLLIIGGATAYFLGAFDSFFGPSEEELQAEQQQADSLGISSSWRRCWSVWGEPAVNRVF